MVSLYLPVLRTPSQEALGDRPTTPLHALVVDDEPAVRGVLVQLLRRLGYAADAADNPLLAIGMVRERPTRYAVALVDVCMPGLSGTELARELRVSAPELPVLLMSGNAGGAAAQAIAQGDATAFIAKPFRMVELRQQLLDMVPNGPLRS